jgi:ABC-type Mn2+/Zn2+ transport system permease subunit
VELPGVDDRREAGRDLAVPRGLLLLAGLGLGAVWTKSCSGVIQNADQLIIGAAQEIELSCNGPSTLYTIGAAILMAVLLVVPIATAVVLARRMRHRTATA